MNELLNDRMNDENMEENEWMKEVRKKKKVFMFFWYWT